MFSAGEVNPVAAIAAVQHAPYTRKAITKPLTKRYRIRVGLRRQNSRFTARCTGATTMTSTHRHSITPVRLPTLMTRAVTIGRMNQINMTAAATAAIVSAAVFSAFIASIAEPALVDGAQVLAVGAVAVLLGGVQKLVLVDEAVDIGDLLERRDDDALPRLDGRHEIRRVKQTVDRAGHAKPRLSTLTSSSPSFMYISLSVVISSSPRLPGFTRRARRLTSPG